MKRVSVELHLEVGVAATLLGGMSRRWIKERIKAGDLDGFLLGNKMVVTAASVNAYLERCRIGQQQQAA